MTYGPHQHIPPTQGPLTSQTEQELRHNLEVHSIELELQNEELRRTQKALEESLQLYHDLYELAPVSFLSLCERGRIVDLNTRASEMLGLPKGNLLGTPLQSYVHSEDRDLLYLHGRQLFRTGIHQCMELRIEPPGNRPFVAWVELVPAVTAQREPMMRVSITDISQRRRQERQERLHTLALDAASNELLFADAAGIIEWANVAFSTSTGYHHGDLIGRQLKQFMSNQETSTDPPWETVDSGQPWHGRMTCQIKDGTTCQRHLNITPVKDLFGKNTHLVVEWLPDLAPHLPDEPIESAPKVTAPTLSVTNPSAPKRLTLKRGQVLFREGDNLSDLYQVASGWVKLSCASHNGRDLLVELLYPGDYFDIRSLLDGRPTSFTASALCGQPAEVHCLPKGQVDLDETMMPKIIRQLGWRIRQQQEMMAAMANDRIEQRLLLALAGMARRDCQQRGDQLVIPLPLTRQELGESIGASTEATIRALSDLQRREAIHWEGRNLVCQATLLAEHLDSQHPKQTPQEGRQQAVER